MFVESQRYCWKGDKGNTCTDKDRDDRDKREGLWVGVGVDVGGGSCGGGCGRGLLVSIVTI